MKPSGIILLMMGIFTISLFTGVGQTYSTDFITEFHDLNDNQVPSGWTLQEYGCCGGLQDGRLWARVIDAQYGLNKVGQLPSGATSMKLEWDGNVAYSYWGHVTGIGVLAGSHRLDVNTAVSIYQYGSAHRVRAYVPGVWDWHDPSTALYDVSFPLVYGDYHYTVTLSEGTVQFKGVYIADGTVRFNVTVNDPELHLDQLSWIEFGAYTTTDNDAWVDNILVQVMGGQPPQNGKKILVYSTRNMYGNAILASDFDTDLPSILAEEGFSVTVTDRGAMPTLTADSLSHYDQLWFISGLNTSILSTSELQAILDFQAAGNGLMVISDGCWYSVPANQFSPSLGVTYSNLRCCDCDHCGGAVGCDIPVSGFSAHEIWNGVGSIQANLNEGDLAASAPAQIIASHNNINMVAVRDGSGGRVAWDATIYRFQDVGVHPDLSIRQAGNAQYARNLANWLAGGGQPPQEYVTLSGHVTQNGLDMSVVTITAVGTSNTDTAETQSDGRYLMSIPKGNYTISASMAGYEFYPTYQIGVFVDNSTVDFVEDHQPPDIVVKDNFVSGNAEKRYRFDFLVTDNGKGNSSLASIVVSLDGSILSSIQQHPDAETSFVHMLDILSLTSGEHDLRVSATDRWGHTNVVQAPIILRKNDFDPTQHGFHFPNWEYLEVSGTKYGGRCTGMSMVAILYKLQGLDLFNMPDNNLHCGDCACDIPPWNSIMRAQIEAAQAVFMLPRGIIANAIARKLLEFRESDDFTYLLQEFTDIKSRINDGKYPAVLLVNGGANMGHTVVAYATIEIGMGSRYIHVYDPNYPFERETGQSGTCHLMTETISFHADTYESGWSIYPGYTFFAELATPASTNEYYFETLLSAGSLAGIVGFSKAVWFSAVVPILKVPSSFAWIRFLSPVSAQIYDANGLKIGHVGDSVFNEIPGAEVQYLGGYVDFFLPADRSYTLITNGLAEGFLHQEIYFPRADLSIDHSYFECQVSTGVTTSTTIGSSSGCPLMYVDRDGDGCFEDSVQALKCEQGWIIPDTVYTCDARPVPPTWYASWLYTPESRLRCLIGNLPEGYSAAEIIPASVRINEAVPSLSEECRLLEPVDGFSGPVLEATFDGVAALQSLDQVEVGGEQVVLLSGRLSDNNMFYTQVNVSIAEGPGFAVLDGYVRDPSINGLLGVTLDIYDSDGNLCRSVVSDDSGYYHVDSIPNGNYSVSVVTPLGYQADQETKEFTIHHVPVTVNFSLTKLAITPRSRSRAYWADQLCRALQNKPKDYTRANFSRFAGLINVHFNQNEVNPVNFYIVPQPANQNDSLMVMKKILTMCNNENEPLLKRLAKAQLMTLMLNVVSGKISQTQVISKDGRTVSQAITYCDMLVNDEIDCPHNGPGHGSPHCRYILVDFILTFINLGLTVPKDMIPADVIQIAYSIHNHENLPTGFALHQNYPNPFNPVCNIDYALPTGSHVTLSIYNLLGQKVRVLVDEYQEAGNKSVKWNGKDDQGQEVTSGIYFYRIKAGDFTETKKMVLVK